MRMVLSKHSVLFDVCVCMCVGIAIPFGFLIVGLRIDVFVILGS